MTNTSASHDSACNYVEVNNSNKVQALRIGEATDELLEKHFPLDDTLLNHHEGAFEAFIRIVVVVNVLKLGVSTQWPAEAGTPRQHVYFCLEVCFCVSYIIEVLLKTAQASNGNGALYGLKAYFVNDKVFQIRREEMTIPRAVMKSINGWNTFDFFLTLSMMLDVFLKLMNFEGGKVMALLRILRVVRLLQVLRGIPALTVVVNGVLGSITTLFWIVVVLTCLIFAFAIIFVTIVDHDFYEPGKDPYADLFTAMLTLVDVVVFNAWRDSLPTTQPELLAPFFMFVTLSAFGVANVIIGVICDAIAGTQQSLHWERNRMKVRALGTMWEEYIFTNNLRTKDLAKLQGEERAEKEKQRNAAKSSLLTEIIERDELGFPPGLDAVELDSMLDKRDNGGLTHEEFILSLGQIFLGDESQHVLMSLVGQGVARKSLWKLKRNLEGRLEKIDGEMREQREVLQQFQSKVDVELDEDLRKQGALLQQIQSEISAKRAGKR